MMTPKDDFAGPALFSYGFRPFFLSATLFALGVIPLWWLIWRGRISIHGPFVPTDWHMHEMVFGYGAAVVAGFLFTAVPNWTGRLPTRGWRLGAFLALWFAGRLAVAGVTGLGALPVALIDQSFLLALAAMIAREIVAGRNWRNLKVLMPVICLWLANLWFHAESAMQGTADIGRRLGIAILIFLIMLIGGRIVPSFTRNWLARRKATRLPVAFNRFDALSLLFALAGLAAWVMAPFSEVTAILCTLSALLQAVRLWRWRGLAVWSSPLLAMLHLAYFAVPGGFLSVAATAAGYASSALPAHVFGIGAIGGMTVAVMMRATMGHTGRDLVAGRGLTSAFMLVLAAMLLRVVDAQGPSVDLAALAWTVAFLLLARCLGPWLVGPGKRRLANPQGRA